MGQAREEVTPHLAERLCWQGACRDDFFYFLQQLGVVDWLDDVQGAAIQREMVAHRPVCLALCPEDAVRGGEHACLARFAV